MTWSWIYPAKLAAEGYEAQDLTDNEMAKLHIRYMVGGRAPADMGRETIYRVEFPERPGALLRFLSGLGQRWNISTFHYRNHGSAFARILVAMQVKPDETQALYDYLDGLESYRYWDETENPAYQLFLA